MNIIYLSMTEVISDTTTSPLLKSIVHNTAQTAQNTHHSFLVDGVNMLAVISIIVAIVALVIDMFMWLGIKGTRSQIKEEAQLDRVDKECQRRLFEDIVRHLYRNKICTLTMYAKYLYMKNIKQHRDCYPSEEHILKLKLLPSDIHFDEYYRNPNIYHKLHEMEMLLRNYNTEIDVAYKHIPDPAIDEQTKKRDFLTLDFKTGMLTERLVNLMNAIWVEQDNLQAVQDIIEETHLDNMNKNSDDTLWSHKYDEQLSAIRTDETARDKYFMKIFTSGKERRLFKQMLDIDTAIEAGQNSKKEEKIHIICADRNYVCP